MANPPLVCKGGEIMMERDIWLDNVYGKMREEDYKKLTISYRSDDYG